MDDGSMNERLGLSKVVLVFQIEIIISKIRTQNAP